MPVGQKQPLVLAGSPCVSDLRGVEHLAEDPGNDPDLLAVHAWLMSHPIERLMTAAVQDSINYVLDGARTWRFDLTSPEVDSDERRTVGTKLQYRVLEALHLPKVPPLDTEILGIAVELKGTTGSNWMIPREGQCEICLMVQVDAAKDRHRAWLMRTHRIWLNAPNGDRKRSIQADALKAYGLPVVPWTDLPPNPLKMLDPAQRAAVFDLRHGQAVRLTRLFGYLPGVVIPRTHILTVCAQRDDPMRRARQIKDDVYRQHGLRVLCGKWPAERDEAAAHGYDISNAAWVAFAP